MIIWGKKVYNDTDEILNAIFDESEGEVGETDWENESDGEPLLSEPEIVQLVCNMYPKFELSSPITKILPTFSPIF